jgi:hypothetical protein
MDEKISLEAIAAYGDAYADRVSQQFFSSGKKISGAEILSLTSIPQINLFIVRELLHTWKGEMRKLKSPYFDYDDKEVKEALEHFMTVLSNHISVDQEHFSPLLKKSVRQTLLLIFNPYDFFSTLVTERDNKVNVGQFREEIKYLRINKAPLARLVETLEERGVEEMSGNEAFAVLDQILEEVNFTPEDVDEHIRNFSEVLPLDPSTFFVARDTPRAEVRPEPEAPRESPRIPLLDEEEEIPSRPTLNDKMQTPQRPVYNNFQKIARIKDHLTINQKFMFTKVLFYGDFESFSRTVDELDQLPDMESAMQYLEEQSSSWDRESREFHEFMEMVEKRFSAD